LIYINWKFPDHVLIPVAAKKTVGSLGHYLKYSKDSNVKKNGGFLDTIKLPDGYELIGSKSKNILNDLGFKYATDLVEVARVGYTGRAKYALDICLKNKTMIFA
jgi:hypothetical protein